MKAIRSILAAVDFSDDSRRAASRAARLAAEHGARLELLHVLSESSLTSLRELFHSRPVADTAVVDQTRAQLEALAEEIRSTHGVTTKARLEVGDALGGIVAASARADLLALGARGRNPLRDRILGTTAERLLGICRLPILVARRSAKGPYRRVVVAIDFSRHSRAALDLALRIAPESRVTLVHAFEAPFEGKLRLAGVDDGLIRDYRSRAKREALTKVLELTGAARGPRERFSHAVAHGAAPRIVLDAAKMLRADLIVIGKQGKSAAEELLLGTVTRHVLAGASCDVLVSQEGAG